MDLILTVDFRSGGRDLGFHYRHGGWLPETRMTVTDGSQSSDSGGLEALFERGGGGKEIGLLGLL